MDENFFLVPARMGVKDGGAVVQLLRECYGVVKGGLAPMGIGLIYETVKPVPACDQRVLGIIPWL